MASDRFLIAPYNSGLQKDLKPWLIPEDAFEELNNVYVWRGRVRKRVGSAFLFGDESVVENQQLLSRLRINIGTTDSSGDLNGTVPGTIFKVGQMFSIGDEIFTPYLSGLAIMLNTGLAGSTYDTTDGIFSFSGAAPLTDVYFYPAEPVMGFGVLDTTVINFERYIAFDTQFSYEYQATGGWQQLDMGAAVWTGDDADFFYSSMYRGVLPNDLAIFTTNNTPSSTGDGIRYFLSATNTWTQLTQSYSSDSNTLILGARIVIQFKGRLLLFNTFEQPGSATTAQYQNRVRYSQIGDPTQTDSWYDATSGVYGKGGAIDAPTQQEIISCQILKDRMIVYFERSTWELVYLNNEILPFRWQNINIELGAESTFSLIPFDKGLLGIGEVGVHVCNGLNVERIDNQIPDQVYTIHNRRAGPARVQGIRDYDAELAYWSVPSVDSSNTEVRYPNELLVYNYKNNSWSLWDDSITAFGYINLNNAVSWQQITYYSWQEWTPEWSFGNNQPRMLRVLAGNQEGFTFYMSRDISRLAPSLQINNITQAGIVYTLSITNNNLTTQNWVLIENVQGTGTITSLNGKIAPVIAASTNSITIVVLNGGVGTYTGGGTISIVPQIDILTKQYNFYKEIGRNFSINQVDLLVDRSDQGSISVDIYPNSGDLSTQELILQTSPYDPLIYPYEQYQDMLWHTIYPRITGSFIQFRLIWNPNQMINPGISLDDFVLHSMLFYAQPTSHRFQ